MDQWLSARLSFFDWLIFTVGLPIDSWCANMGKPRVCLLCFAHPLETLGQCVCECTFLNKAKSVHSVLGMRDSINWVTILISFDLRSKISKLDAQVLQSKPWNIVRLHIAGICGATRVDLFSEVFNVMLPVVCRGACDDTIYAKYYKIQKF